MKNAFRQDTKMAEGIDDDTETDMEIMDCVEADDTNTSLNIGRNNVGELMNEDPMKDALRAGSGVYIDLCETPERESPESGIPDSFDRAEEETVEEGRQWPA